MKRKWIFFTIVAALVFIGYQSVSAQAVCGDPTAACRDRENFQAGDLPFNMGKNVNFSDSVWFYGIVLKSAKMKEEWGDCDNPQFTESEREAAQALFPKNKVFTLNCVQSGSNYYPGVADHIAFIGIYAGRNLAEANAFLKKVVATKKYPGIKVRRMRISVNGT